MAMEDIEMECWIAPDQGYSLRKATKNIHNKERNEEKENMSFEAEVEQHQPSGVWFPKSWRYSRKLLINGEETKNEETGLVTVHALNEPIDPACFSMENMDIPAGTEVIWALESPPPAKGTLYWDGHTIVSQGDFFLKQIEPQKRKSRMALIVSVNAALIFGIVALHLYRRYRRLKPC